MIDESVIETLRVRYAHVHPLLFHRSVERARDAAELFDILDTMPVEFPIVWSNRQHRWHTALDITMRGDFDVS